MKKQRMLWQVALARNLLVSPENSTVDLRLRRALGRWVDSPNQHWEYYIDTISDTLLEYSQSSPVNVHFRKVTKKRKRYSHEYNVDVYQYQGKVWWDKKVPADVIITSGLLVAAYGTIKSKKTERQESQDSRGFEGYVASLAPERRRLLVKCDI